MQTAEQVMKKILKPDLPIDLFLKHKTLMGNERLMSDKKDNIRTRGEKCVTIDINVGS